MHLYNNTGIAGQAIVSLGAGNDRVDAYADAVIEAGPGDDVARVGYNVRCFFTGGRGSDTLITSNRKNNFLDFSEEDVVEHP